MVEAVRKWNQTVTAKVVEKLACTKKIRNVIYAFLYICPSTVNCMHVRGVYTIESLEQMLQKNFRGEDLTSNQGGMYSKKIFAD